MQLLDREDLFDGRGLAGVMGHAAVQAENRLGKASRGINLDQPTRTTGPARNSIQEVPRTQEQELDGQRFLEVWLNRKSGFHTIWKR